MSRNKIATQSSIAKGPTYLYKAENAVDRNTETCMRTDLMGPQSPNKTVWWRVDLGGVYNIYSVNILFKNYDGAGAYNKKSRQDTVMEVGSRRKVQHLQC